MTEGAQYSSGPQAANPAEVGWLPCAPCDGTGVVYAAGPDYFGKYDSDDCPACRGHGAVPPRAPTCPTKTPEPHLLGEFPMTCYRCHIEADS